jgi:chromosome segregation ATPase
MGIKSTRSYKENIQLRADLKAANAINQQHQELNEKLRTDLGRVTQERDAELTVSKHIFAQLQETSRKLATSEQQLAESKNCIARLRTSAMEGCRDCQKGYDLTTQLAERTAERDEAEGLLNGAEHALMDLSDSYQELEAKLAASEQQHTDTDHIKILVDNLFSLEEREKSLTTQLQASEQRVKELTESLDRTRDILEQQRVEGVSIQSRQGSEITRLSFQLEAAQDATRKEHAYVVCLRRQLAERTAERDRLRGALKQAQGVVCVHCCPTTWTSDQPQPHCGTCEKARVALGEPESKEE